MSRRLPSHHEADQLRRALGCDELVILARCGAQLGYVAAAPDGRGLVSARRMGDVAFVAACRDRGEDAREMLGYEHGDAADGAPAPAAPVAGGDEAVGHA